MPAPAVARESCGDTEWGVQGAAGQQGPTQQAQSSKRPRTQHTAAAPTDVGIMDLFEGLPAVEQQATGVIDTAAHGSTWQHQPPTTLDNLGTHTTASAQLQITAGEPQEDMYHNRAVAAWVEPASAPGQTIIPAGQALPDATTSNAPWPSHISAPPPAQPPAAQDGKEAKRRDRLVREWLPVKVTVPDPAPRPQVNNHTLLRPLCHGGFATVYEAQDDKTGELCAFKLSTQRLLVLDEDQDEETLDDPKFLKKLHDTNWHYRCFEREVNTYTGLGCEDSSSTTRGLPHLKDYGITLLPGKEVHAFVSMTLLGQSVYSEICAGRTREPGSFKRIAFGMLGALEYMHRRGYVHRDIKPGNFCLTTRSLGDDPAAFILDFGFAKRMRDPAHWEEYEAFEGTPDYASVASLRGKRQGPRDDLESLAYTMVEMLQGTLLWDVTDPRTWPPEALARLQTRKRKQAGGDGVAEPLCPADMEWSDHNLGIMADLRDAENKKHAATGFIPKPLVAWIRYVRDLKPLEHPSDYDYLYRLVEQCAAWQLSRWPTVVSELTAQRLGVPALTMESPRHAVAPLSGCLSGGSYGLSPGDAESFHSACSKRRRDSSWGDEGAEQDGDEYDGYEEDQLPEAGHLFCSEDQQPGPSKKLRVDVNDSRLYAREE